MYGTERRNAIVNVYLAITVHALASNVQRILDFSGKMTRYEMGYGGGVLLQSHLLGVVPITEPSIQKTVPNRV
jgi:hypothetical protein